MKDVVQRTTHGGIRAWRSGLLVLAGLAILVSAGTEAALAGNGGSKTPPGQAKKAEKAAAQPVHPSHPAHPAKTRKPSSPGKSAEAQHHVIICHRTGSATNPYVVVNVSIRAWQHGHQNHPAIDGRNDILLQDPATPGEKLPVSRCPAGAHTSPITSTTASPSTPATTVPAPTHATSAPEITVVVDSTKPGVENAPATTIVDTPLMIVVHTMPNSTVTVQGAGVSFTGGILGAATAISNKRGVARIEVVPTKQGILTVKVGHRTVKRFGVLGAHTSGTSLTG
jgi:hypothetical protein